MATAGKGNYLFQSTFLRRRRRRRSGTDMLVKSISSPTSSTGKTVWSDWFFEPTVVTNTIKKVGTLLWANVKRVGTVTRANIKKIFSKTI